MKPSTLSFNTFNSSHRRLCELAQVLVLEVVRRVQAQVKKLIGGNATSPELQRWIKSDLAETLLSRDAEVVATMPEYLALTKVNDRTSMLEHTLTCTLIAWLITKASLVETDILLATIHTLYGEQGADSCH